MQLGVIRGTVVATQKVRQLKGIPLKILIPCDDEKNPTGDPIVAVDDVGARTGDLVLWVGKREASMAIRDAEISNFYAVDAAVTGIVDDIG